MTDSVRDLIPVAPTDSLVRAWSFRLLLETGQPVADSEVVIASGLSGEEVRQQAEAIAREGRLTRDDSGQIVGSAGLTVLPTPHSLAVGVRQFWTWCAVDAIGIMAALHATGSVTSSDFDTGEPIALTFADGRAEATDVVIFVSGEAGSDCYVVEEWCPTVNFFTSRKTAEAWAVRHKAQGVVADIDTVAQACTDGWLNLLEVTADHKEAPTNGHSD